MLIDSPCVSGQVAEKVGGGDFRDASRFGLKAQVYEPDSSQATYVGTEIPHLLKNAVFPQTVEPRRNIGTSLRWPRIAL